MQTVRPADTLIAVSSQCPTVTPSVNVHLPQLVPGFETVFLNVVGATAAEKLEGTSRGVDANPLPFPLPFPPRLPLLFNPSLLFCLSPLKFSKNIWGSTVSFQQCPAKMTASCNSWRTATLAVISKAR